MNKKLALICQYSIFPERLGGMDRFFVAYDKAAKERGYTIIWFFSDVKSFDFYNSLTIENADGTNIEQYFLDYCKKSKTKFDIVVTHFLQPVSAFYKAIKTWNQNTYIINVDHNPRPLNGFPIKKRIKNKIKGLMYGKYIDQLIGVSNYTSNYILKDFGNHLKNKTKTIYNGIAIDSCKKQKLDRSLKPFRFVVVSHLRASKGIQDLMHALHSIDSGLLKDFEIDIYGEGPYKEALQQLSNTYELTNYVHFKGSVPTINKQLHKYHYLIQPTYMECFSLSLLESLACNVPVITTTVGGNLELITDQENGFIFTPKDSKHLAKILSNLLNHSKIISGDVSELIATNFTLEKMVNQHLKLIQ